MSTIEPYIITLKDYFLEAALLYSKCEDKLKVEPITWVINQDKMRSLYEEYKASLREIPDDLRKCVELMPEIQYCTYMYNTYPIGFGNRLHVILQDTSVDHNNVPIDFLYNERAALAFLDCFKHNKKA